MIVCVPESQLKRYHKTSKLIQTTRYIAYNMHSILFYSILFKTLGTSQSKPKHNQAEEYFTYKAYLFIELKRIKMGEVYLDNMHNLGSASKNYRVG